MMELEELSLGEFQREIEKMAMKKKMRRRRKRKTTKVREKYPNLGKDLQDLPPLDPGVSL